MAIQFSGVKLSGGLQLTGVSGPAVNNDPYWANVVLLMSTTASNNQTNNTFLDSSTNNFTVTRVGTVTQGSYSPFPTRPANTAYSTTTNGGSGFFGGDGNYLTSVSTNALNFGTGDFTFECWINFSTAAGTQFFIADARVTGATTAWVFSRSATNQLQWFSGQTYTYNSTTTLTTTNTWTHIAAVRRSGTFTCYINGVDAGGGGSDTTNYNINNSPLTIGSRFGSQVSGTYFTGFMSNLRIVKGTAVYTGNFTPSTTPLTAISGTTTLLNFTNAGIYDSSNSTVMLTTNGGAKVSTAQKKFTSSLAVAGGTDSVTYGTGTLALSTNNFTLEGWVYTIQTNTAMGIMGYCDSVPTAATSSFTIATTSIGKLQSAAYSGTTVYGCTSTGNLPTSQWVHIAFVRNGTTLTQYINGVADGTATIGAASVNSAAGQLVGIGKQGSMTTNLWVGNIEQVRFTPGVARYTSNFTPPAANFPLY